MPKGARFPRAALAVALLFAAFIGSASSAIGKMSEAAMPKPLTELFFGMSTADARKRLPKATYLEPGIEFGPLRAQLVLPRASFFGTRFRIYLQFGPENRLRQILAERRHADATPEEAALIQKTLFNRFGAADETCLPQTATPAAAWIAWHRDGLSYRLKGFDDLGLGMLTRDAYRGAPLSERPMGRNRLERQRVRQQRSLPRRILLLIHPEDDKALQPPPCGAAPSP